MYLIDRSSAFQRVLGRYRGLGTNQHASLWEDEVISRDMMAWEDEIIDRDMMAWEVEVIDRER